MNTVEWSPLSNLFKYREGVFNLRVKYQDGVEESFPYEHSLDFSNEYASHRDEFDIMNDHQGGILTLDHSGHITHYFYGSSHVSNEGNPVKHFKLEV